MKRHKTLINTVQTFLKSERINCVLTTEDEKTGFWYYQLEDQRMTGFISIHEHDSDPVLSASLTIGLMAQHRKIEAMQLLEQNMALHNGLALASEMESMVVVRFVENTEILTTVRLLFLLGQLHIEANELRQKFLINSQLLAPLPMHWFHRGSDE